MRVSDWCQRRSSVILSLLTSDHPHARQHRTSEAPSLCSPRVARNHSQGGRERWKGPDRAHCRSCSPGVASVLATRRRDRDPSRNVAGAISPPKAAESEVEILDADQVAIVLHRLDGHDLYPIAAVALATGMRRGEILGLQLGDIDLEAASLKVDRSLEETAQGLRFKAPETKHGRRSLSRPPSAVTVLRDQRRRQLETGWHWVSAGRPLMPSSSRAWMVRRSLRVSSATIGCGPASHETCQSSGVTRCVTARFCADLRWARRRGDLPTAGACESDGDAQRLCPPVRQDRHSRGERYRGRVANGQGTVI